MGLILNITESTFGSNTSTPVTLHLPAERMTLADLIQRRAEAQVEERQRQLEAKTEDRSPFTTLKESLLSGKTGTSRSARSFQGIDSGVLPDPERAGYVALEAFKQNAFFVIIDGEQREELQEELLLRDDSEVEFIRLMPLIGG